MRNRRRQVDVTHALTTYFGLSYFNTTLLTDHTTVLETLVLTTQTFVIFDRTKDTRTEQTITFWLEGTVVNGFWLFNFTKRPGTNHIRRGEADADCIELVSVVLITQKIN